MVVKPKHVGAILCTPKQIYSASVLENKKDFDQYHCLNTAMYVRLSLRPSLH